MKRNRNRAIIQFILVAIAIAFGACHWMSGPTRKPFADVTTIAGNDRSIDEPFGIAVKNGEMYISDGSKGKIFRIGKDGTPAEFASGLSTPSQIAFDSTGNLLVADSGTHSIKRITTDGKIVTIAGKDGEAGYADGNAISARFRAPIGLAIVGSKIYVADTYNDRIRVIENGKVSTLAGNNEGFSDGDKAHAKFDTPTGLAVWNNGRILVADTANARLRVVEPNGRVWTLVGNDSKEAIDGDLASASLAQPSAVAVNLSGEIYIADGNSIRAIGTRVFPFVETICGQKLGFKDGERRAARFNRPSGLAFDATQNLLIADSANSLVRAMSSPSSRIGKELPESEFAARQLTAQEFRKLSPPRWTYDPPNAPRDIAGTLGEIRGEIAPNEKSWFHNGLDIAGAYGEIARFIRDEKVLRPIATENFGEVRELIRMPSLGYIHIRLGRDKDHNIFDDPRFLFQFDAEKKPIGVRVPRGTSFKSGEAIGTLNSYNHVHLVVGKEGHEFNALDALEFPGIKDSLTPTFESIELFKANWEPIGEGADTEERIVDGKIRIVAQAFDQMDGNPTRRKLGVYKLGYQVLDSNGKAVSGFEDIKWSIIFDMMPDSDAVTYAYADGSKSGATGETLFRYIPTNRVSNASFSESFLDTRQLKAGNYILRVSAADYFGNSTASDLKIMKK